MGESPCQNLYSISSAWETGKYTKIDQWIYTSHVHEGKWCLNSMFWIESMFEHWSQHTFDWAKLIDMYIKCDRFARFTVFIGSNTQLTKLKNKK